MKSLFTALCLFAAGFVTWIGVSANTVEFMIAEAPADFTVVNPCDINDPGCDTRTAHCDINDPGCENRTAPCDPNDPGCDNRTAPCDPNDPSCDS